MVVIKIRQNGLLPYTEWFYITLLLSHERYITNIDIIQKVGSLSAFKLIVFI